jgi:hypothetical protein
MQCINTNAFATSDIRASGLLLWFDTDFQQFRSLILKPAVDAMNGSYVHISPSNQR